MLNKEKGITLIALIITIIVMLILVGVTINVALNGGLFEKAETATTETKKALEKEELMQIVLAEYDVKSDVVNADNVKTQATNYTEDTSKSKAGKTLVLKGKSGIFWEINLETAQVKEYEEVTVTSTIWAERGMTSPNVKFDTLYYGDELNIEQDGYVPYSNLSFGAYINGDMHLDIDGGEPTWLKDAEGKNNIGDLGADSETCQYYLDNDYAKVFSNGMVCPIINAETFWLTFRYTADNTIEVYAGYTDDLLDGVIPETEEYFGGTLYPVVIEK